MAVVIPSRIWEYSIAAFLIILAPGPSVLFTIARAIAWGRTIALLTVVGNILGMYTMAVIVSFGLSPILAKSHLAFTGVQWLGGFYLIYLGYSAIKESPRHADDMLKVVEAKPSRGKTIRQGYLVGALNPKGFVFFAAILPQFIDRDRGSITFQMLLMSTIFAVIGFISDGTWGVLAGTVRNWFASDVKRLVRLRITGGCVMILLGVLTLVNSFRS